MMSATVRLTPFAPVDGVPRVKELLLAGGCPKPATPRTTVAAARIGRRRRRASIEFGRGIGYGVIWKRQRDTAGQGAGRDYVQLLNPVQAEFVARPFIFNGRRAVGLGKKRSTDWSRPPF